MKFYQFERKWGIPNLSPFCCKTETYLRMANIEYEIKVTLPSEAPKGKLPYSKIVMKSWRIPVLSYCTLKDLDTGLNPAELALSVAMQRLLRSIFIGHPIFAMAVYRCKLANHKEAMFGTIPPNIRELTAIYYHHTIK